MRFRLILLLVILARQATAQRPDTTSSAPGGTTVNGVVRDSIARTPLSGAMVQIVSLDGPRIFARAGMSDSTGHFTLGNIPDGRYTIGFIHPMLDSLGMEPPVREVRVDGGQPVRADLAIPSLARLRAAICGQRPPREGSALLVGVVRDAQGNTPAAGVTVAGEWLELSFRPDGLVRRIPRIVAITAENGWFAMCDVPADGTMALVASKGADSTGIIEVNVPAAGFLRRELFLGPARTVITADTMRRADSLAPQPRRVRVGNGRLSGVVVSVVGDKPLPGAQVRITGGPETRANERGEWILANAPVGTRMLEVRALGYYPERRRVDVVEGAAPLRVSLSTLKTVLDTVRILASRRVYDRDRNGFQQRRRAGIGQYLTADDIRKHNPVVTSEIFRSMSGVRLEYDSDGLEQYILVRGNMSEWCSPAIYLDGRHLVGVTGGDLDVWVHPDEVAGIEVYAGVGAPLQYQQAMTGCGSILIWSK